MGTRAAFLATMIGRLASADHPELARLTTRAPDDPALALLDAWACVGDVLTFYQERIANEGYLATAKERRSLVELAALVGYRPRPGLAASAWLAYTLDPDPADPLVRVPAGARVQSVPDPGAKPQIFETAGELVARPSWGALPPRLRRPTRLTRCRAASLRVVHVEGVATGLAPNDRLLFHFTDGSPLLRIVESAETDLDAQVTAVRLQSLPLGLAEDGEEEAEFVRLEVLRAKAATFGAAAPLPPPTPRIAEVAADDPDWELDESLYDSDSGARTLLPLDADYPRILPGSWIVVVSGDGLVHVNLVKEVRTLGLARYGLSGRVTALVLVAPWFPEEHGDAGRSLAELRGYTFYAQAEPLVLADEPVTGPVEGGSIDLGVVIQDLPTGRTIVVSGMPQDAGPLTPPGGEVARVIGTRRVSSSGSVPDHTVLDLAAPLRGSYRRSTVTVWANVVRATNGETKLEPAAGSGDAGTAGQRFTLGQQPLTYVATPDADGAEAELVVRVGGIAWHEVPELAWAGPSERAYQLSVDAAGGATVEFGDGRRGSRLPTGTGNVAFTYRVGIGRAGNVGAGQLSQLQTKPLGVSAVTNPLRAGGGTDHDADPALRGRAPLPTLAMDRLVGLRDYADFTLARAGVGKAEATRLSAGGRELVHLTVAGVDDAPIEPDSDLLRGLLAACRRYGDPGVPVAAAPRTLWNVVLEANVWIDADRTPDLVGPQARAALESAFGFDARALGRAVYLSEVVAALQRVPGVAFAHVVRLGATRGTTAPDAAAVTGVADRIPARAARTRADGVHIDPAELVLIRPGLDGFVVLHVEVAR
ncbi:putative baseplate assembly protein [Nonomuraea jabiensis]|uniref:Putative phage baseplate assembly protein n=1 Tax=Nonomuraea jabiensis TaxID=882448 RepID=A0A7W9LGF5_9ACTN|nr:putative baseplate assembly protein [Nonomuraea jabiensis]MBB5782862.1 putative phage baseplate assembly protein [Nonomuraea jabiensis]